jgi:hypothetical protein
VPSAHPRLRIALLQTAETQPLIADLAAGLDACGAAATEEAVKRWLQRHVPEYRPG